MTTHLRINFARKALAILFFATLAISFAGYWTLRSFAGQDVLNGETFTFPARSSDLDEGAVWSVNEFDEGCCILDLNVSKYSNGGWRDGTGSSTNEQDYTFEVPIYAPANGRIASCWRNFPDDPSPGVQPPNNDRIFKGGNHVVIITDDNNAISLNHFKSGTIRPELCPRNNDNTTFPATQDLDPGNNWRLAAYIDRADRPRIREGEYIGQAGNSGQSGGPHLHISVQPVTCVHCSYETLGAAVPFRFRQAWGHRYEASDRDTPEGWYRWRGGQFSGNPACSGYQANSPECGFKMIHASPYLRRTDAKAGVIKKVDTLFLSGNRAITAVINSNDQLQLTSWDLVGVDQIIRRNDITAGTVKDVQIVEAASDYVLAAVRGEYDELKLIAYLVGPTGFFSRVAEYTAGDISALAMVTTWNINKKIVTAVRDEDDNLKLIVWDLQFDYYGNASIARLGQEQAGEVSSLAMATARNFDGVFTAVRDGNQNLLVIPWKISADGYTITRGDSGSAGEIKQEISVAALARGVAVAVVDNDGDLRVKTWESSTGGDITAQRDTIVEGAVSEIELLSTPLSGSNLTAVVRDSEGNLRLIGLLMNDNGSNLRRIGTSKAGAASRIAAAGVSRSYPGLDPRDMILTALRDSEGELKLITWDTNLNNP
jgi:hypothetical protein